jgi:uncharacterized protein (TIGR02145 family)
LSSSLEDVSSSSGEQDSSSSEDVSSSSGEQNSSSSEDASSSGDIGSSSSEALTSSSGGVSFCDGKPYSKDEQFCFENKKLYPLCKGQDYNVNAVFCYENEIYDLCDGKDYNPIKEFCSAKGEVKDKCGTKDYNPSEEYCIDDIIKAACGTSLYYVVETQFCYEGNKVGNKCGARTEIFDPDKYECKNGDKIYLREELQPIDDNNKSYKAVLIGTQTWMAENLNYCKDLVIGSCVSFSGGNTLGIENTPACDIYGRLYTWSVAMNYSAGSTDNHSGVQGICPSGWHLPSNAEWDVLVKYVDPDYVSTDNNSAGNKLKAKSGWNDYDGKSGNGTDNYGFLALPGGVGKYSFYGNAFSSVGTYGTWWSAEGYVIDDYAYRMSISSNREYAGYSFSEISDFASVRCVRD